ncbi:MAG: hypothetical protein ACE3JP_04180 [Ectobacillus sp.]
MKKSTEFNKASFQNYMALYRADDIRWTVFTLVFLLADIFVLLLAFAPPFQPLYACIVAPPVLFLNVWALWIMMNPQKRRLQYTLFRGVYGIIVSLGLMVVVQKFAYGSLGLQSPLFFILSFGAYGFAFYHYYKNHIKKLKQPPQRPRASKGMNVSLSAAVALGYLAAQISLGFVTDQIVAVVLMCVLSMLAFVLFHFIMELHRYYYLRQYLSEREFGNCN